MGDVKGDHDSDVKRSKIKPGKSAEENVRDVPGQSWGVTNWSGVVDPTTLRRKRNADASSAETGKPFCINNPRNKTSFERES